MGIPNEDFDDLEAIQLNMSYDQLVNVYGVLEQVKKENQELQETVKTYKQLMLHYKKYFDACYALIIVRSDVCEFVKWAKMSFGLTPNTAQRDIPPMRHTLFWQQQLNKHMPIVTSQTQASKHTHEDHNRTQPI